ESPQVLPCSGEPWGLFYAFLSLFLILWQTSPQTSPVPSGSSTGKFSMNPLNIILVIVTTRGFYGRC
ncbi:MAG: hypothetical protein NTX25_16640, partial [Proteobacteria bacterium]|nr:hypothetical protein [Pseudomonadota bacterium]